MHVLCVSLRKCISRTCNRSLHFWNTVFFGNDNYSLRSLQELCKHSGEGKLINRLEVVTISASKYENISANPVYKFAKENGIKTHDWPPDLNGSFHFGIVVSFGKLIPKDLIDYFPMGMLNVHASLLPKYRGASPIIYAIKNGDSETGVTILPIKPHKFDIGEIIIQKSLNIGADELMPSLHSRLAQMGAECLIETISSLPECLKTARPQNNDNVSYALKVNPKMAEVHWCEMTVIEVYNLYRALYSMHNLCTKWNGTKVKLDEILLPSKEELNSITLAPGYVQFAWKKKLLRIGCKTGFVYVLKVVLKGKKLTAADFHNGYKSHQENNLWFFET